MGLVYGMNSVICSEEGNQIDLHYRLKLFPRVNEQMAL